MDIRNCKRCGNIFNYRGISICNNCVTQDEKDYGLVRDYIIEHPNSSTVEVSEATGVSVKTISRFIREGRLDSDSFDTSDSDIVCEKCGRNINSGRYCDLCLNEMQSSFREAARKIESTESPAAKVKPREVVHTYDNILGKDK